MRCARSSRRRRAGTSRSEDPRERSRRAPHRPSRSGARSPRRARALPCSERRPFPSGASWVWPRVPRLTDGNIVATNMHALDALGNPVRRTILSTLRTSPLAVGELATRFPVSRPAISRHLRVLEEAGLVEHRAQGARSVYAVRVQGLASVRDFLDEFWDTALSQLEELARE